MLLLFDIDGTLLLRAAKEHALALIGAMEMTYGVSDLHSRGMEVAGRTDPAIARRYLTLADVDDKRIDERMAPMFDVAIEQFVRLCPDDLSDHVNPGMPAVLDELQPDHDLSLVTGNLEPIARLKLKRAGIGHYFDEGQGGFGSDHEDRALLPAIARKRAGDHPCEDTVVIGDTPRDIACARADDLKVIAIATGPFGAAELQEADVVITRPNELPGAIASL
jgi:phosphoglycolate phosphatase